MSEKMTEEFEKLYKECRGYDAGSYYPLQDRYSYCDTDAAYKMYKYFVKKIEDLEEALRVTHERELILTRACNPSLLPHDFDNPTKEVDE